MPITPSPPSSSFSSGTMLQFRLHPDIGLDAVFPQERADGVHNVHRIEHPCRRSRCPGERPGSRLRGPGVQWGRKASLRPRCSEPFAEGPVHQLDLEHGEVVLLLGEGKHTVEALEERQLPECRRQRSCRETKGYAPTGTMKQPGDDDSRAVSFRANRGTLSEPPDLGDEGGPMSGWSTRQGVRPPRRTARVVCVRVSRLPRRGRRSCPQPEQQGFRAWSSWDIIQPGNASAECGMRSAE